jgi:hypothetical protein
MSGGHEQHPINTDTNVDMLASDELTAQMTGTKSVGACGHGSVPRCSFQQQNTAKLVEAIEKVKPLLSNDSVRMQFESFEEKRRRASG